MIVIFISECEKKALKKTRQVLDAFANRIGHRTWKTVITNEGLKAVKKLLSKTASKSSAVACHLVRGHTQTELVWIVGNRSKFDAQGFVPVNFTLKNIMNTQWENDWHYMPLIKSLAALAGLFHDFGKSSLWFQEKLKNAVEPKSSGKSKQSDKYLGDPLRHEWISCLLLDSIDSPLSNLPDAACLIKWLILSHHKMPLINDKDRLENFRNSPAATLTQTFNMITKEWGYENLQDGDKKYKANLKKCFDFPEGLPNQSEQWQKQIKKWSAKMADCLPLLEQSMKDGSFRLILHYSRLCLMVGDHYYSSQDRDPKWQTSLNLFANTGIKPFTNTGKKPYANERVLKQKLDEHLVGVAKNALNLAHLLPAFENQLPFVEDAKELRKKSPSNSKYIWQDKAVDKIKIWQEDSGLKTHTSKIQDLENSSSTFHQSTSKYGFFAVNMASTGCGKTLANAKIMQALSEDGKRLRYTLALGLRTLTLQTGDEYRERIHLDDTELAVVIGSKAVKELHEYNKTSENKSRDSNQNSQDFNGFNESEYEQSGSESMEDLLDEEVHYECSIPETNLTTILGSGANKENNRKFLYAPVLVCTIDHLMSATETKRGGRYMLPALRLLSSDLVIDEVDDFNGNDLIAIGRLIHLAGMSGCKVMISSATIPPDLAEGYFNAYRQGWELYSKTRDAKSSIGCCWIDEFNTKVESLTGVNQSIVNYDYQAHHHSFINKRVEKLKNQPVKRKADIVECQDIIADFTNNSNALNNSACSNNSDVSDNQITYEQAYFEKIREAIIEKHLQHNTAYNQHNTTYNKHLTANEQITKDKPLEKKISFGVVRVAHIKTCISLAKHLIESEWQKNFAPKIMAYHSRQVLLLRSEQEKHLDQVLKRKEGQNEEPAAFQNTIIRNHIENSSAENIIFILVATPVEEIGRDHDFDWAVVEPSSFRSIIQLAGRIMRHREQQTLGLGNLNNNLKEPNMALMQYNLKALNYAIQNNAALKDNKGYEGLIALKSAYCNPGYEGVIEEGGSRFNLITHDLRQLLDEKTVNQKIDAVPRIERTKDLKELKFTADKQLAALEHYVMHNILTMYDRVGPESMQGWLTQNWWLTAIPQSLTKFREGRPEIKLHLVYENYDNFYFDSSFDSAKPQFMEKNSKGIFIAVGEIYRIEHKTIDQVIDPNKINRLWLKKDYLSLLETIQHERGISVRAASIKYGEISFPDNSCDSRQQQYIYSDQFGLEEAKD